MGRLRALNQFNDAPDDGNMYVMMRASYSLDGTNISDTLRKVSPELWAFVANGRIMDAAKPFGLIVPKPPFEGEILPPGSVEGWVVSEVPQTDELYAVFAKGAERADGSKGFWFALK